ncbi:hypothetical protein RI129_008272 [Pyrocoelia pectoralis]|uniref:THAP-type domain-containing protein n=1 Tax=Pyrocoelia pectoralis TaxID=417401 RepID=A0AAN7V517_9COLE
MCTPMYTRGISNQFLLSLHLNKEYSYYKFPADKNLKDQCMRAIRRENFNPTNDSVICGKHFKDADFLRKVPTKVLKSDAIPSVFDFPVHLEVKSPKHRRTIIRHPLPPSRLPNQNSVYVIKFWDYTLPPKYYSKQCHPLAMEKSIRLPTFIADFS